MINSEKMHEEAESMFKKIQLLSNNQKSLIMHQIVEVEKGGKLDEKINLMLVMECLIEITELKTQINSLKMVCDTFAEESMDGL